MFKGYSHTEYGNHSVSLFVTELDNDGDWCRLADGWSDSYQTWHRYDYLKPLDGFYLRWN